MCFVTKDSNIINLTDEDVTKWVSYTLFLYMLVSYLAHNTYSSISYIIKVNDDSKKTQQQQTNKQTNPWKTTTTIKFFQTGKTYFPPLILYKTKSYIHTAYDNGTVAIDLTSEPEH